jgi:hypothetical protein
MLLLDGFLGNLILTFMKICPEYLNVAKIGQNNWALYVKT